MKIRGFTLLELVMVMVLLGLVAVTVSEYLSTGTQIYRDAALREKTLSGARFALERLNREVRQMVPNGMRTNNNALGQAQHCVEFIPARDSALYVSAPINNLSANAPLVLVGAHSRFDGLEQQDLAVVIYATQACQVFADCSGNYKTPVLALTASGAQRTQVEITPAFNFDKASPAQRVYFSGAMVSYCLQDGQLWRSENSQRELMANNIRPAVGKSPFEVIEPSLNRHALLKINWMLTNSDEAIAFDHVVHSYNSP